MYLRDRRCVCEKQPHMCQFIRMCQVGVNSVSNRSQMCHSSMKKQALHVRGVRSVSDQFNTFIPPCGPTMLNLENEGSRTFPGGHGSFIEEGIREMRVSLCTKAHAVCDICGIRSDQWSVKKEVCTSKISAKSVLLSRRAATAMMSLLSASRSGACQIDVRCSRLGITYIREACRTGDQGLPASAGTRHPSSRDPF